MARRCYLYMPVFSSLTSTLIKTEHEQLLACLQASILS